MLKRIKMFAYKSPGFKVLESNYIYLGKEGKAVLWLPRNILENRK